MAEVITQQVQLEIRKILNVNDLKGLGSSLRRSNQDFPRIGGMDFEEWLGFFSQRGGARMLEIGGGEYQTAAREILDSYTGISRFIAVDRVSPVEQAREITDEYLSYDFLKIDLNQLEEVIEPDQKFDIIFAYLIDLPNPFSLLEQASRLLDRGGVFFYSRIPAYEEIFPKVASYINQRGSEIEYKFRPRDSRLIRPAIMIADVAFRNREGQAFELPLREGSEQLMNSEGQRFIARELSFIS